MIKATRKISTLNKKSPGSGYEQGFILLDSLIGFVILAMVLFAFGSLYSSVVKSVTNRQESVFEYLEKSSEFIDETTYVFTE